MEPVALVTDSASFPVDHDMPLILEACTKRSIDARVCSWDEASVDWAQFGMVILRSPWTYMSRLPEFLSWAEHVAEVSKMSNPLPVVRWNIDKRYLADLSKLGVPVVPTTFFDSQDNGSAAVSAFVDANPYSDFVVKPTVGAYSLNVRRFSRSGLNEAVDHLESITADGSSAMLQPYLEAIDRAGETDMTFFDGSYSHSIRKEPLLLDDGTTSVPTFAARSSRMADQDELALGRELLKAVTDHLGLQHALLYSRIDLVRDAHEEPVVLELEVCEPSLNLSFDSDGATRFVDAIHRRIAAPGQ